MYRDPGQGEVWTTSWLFHFAGWGSCLLLLEAAMRTEKLLSRGGSPLHLQRPNHLHGPLPGHSSAHCWGLWLTLVSGSMRCPMEGRLCSWQCSFQPSSITPHPGPRSCGASCQSLDGGAATQQHLPPLQALSATTHHPRTKSWLFLTSTGFPGYRMSPTILLLVIKCSHTRSPDSCKLD